MIHQASINVDWPPGTAAKATLTLPERLLRKVYRGRVETCQEQPPASALQ